MALKMTPAEALAESMARIPLNERTADDVWATLEHAARSVASADTASLIYTLLGGGAAGWALPTPATLQFPRDHALHLDAGPEWYWLTANLTPVGGGGPHFGLVVCLQRQRILAEYVEREGGWTKDQAQLVQSQSVLVIAGPDGDQVVQQYRNIWTPLGGEIGFSADPFRFQCGPDHFAGPVDVLPLTLHVEGGPLFLDLSITSDLPAASAYFLQGDKGITAPPRGGFYYSWPQLKLAGTVVAEGITYAVEGNGWLDHECMSSIIPAGGLGGPPPKRWSPPFGIDGWTFCDFNLDNGDALVLAGFQVGVLSTRLAAPYGFYLRREGEAWTPIPLTGEIDMDQFLPLTCDVMLPIAWRCRTKGVAEAGLPTELIIETSPFALDGSFVGANLSVMAETPVAVTVSTPTRAPDASPPVLTRGVGYCESVGYEPAARFMARALAALSSPAGGGDRLHRQNIGG